MLTLLYKLSWSTLQALTQDGSQRQDPETGGNIQMASGAMDQDIIVTGNDVRL